MWTNQVGKWLNSERRLKSKQQILSTVSRTLRLLYLQGDKEKSSHRAEHRRAGCHHLLASQCCVSAEHLMPPALPRWCEPDIYRVLQRREQRLQKGAFEEAAGFTHQNQIMI